jgi:Flp pilus assembly protein TadD
MNAKLGNYPAATDFLSKAEVLAPQNADVPLNLSVVLATVGRTQEAAAQLHRAYELRPDDPRIRQFADQFHIPLQ